MKLSYCANVYCALPLIPHFLDKNKLEKKKLLG